MLFYMCGQLGWAYFVRCWGGNSSVFTANAGLFAKVYFPRLVVPLASSMNALFGIFIQFSSFLFFWCYFKFFTPAGNSFGFSWALLLVPVGLVQSMGLGMGVGLWFSSLSAKYRDVSRLGSMLTSAWMYATPVVYSMTMVKDRFPAWLQWVPLLNPMSWVVECFRKAFLGVGLLDPRFIAISLIVSTIVFLSGVMIFNKTERTFIDTV